MNALDSPCQKMQFGSVIIYQSTVMYEGCNRFIEPLKSLCEPECIRLKIQSRTESMIGACGHAEELGVYNILRCGIDPKRCALYVAGFSGSYLPYLKTKADFTCLRCAVCMYNAGIGRIYVPMVNSWALLTPEQAVETAKAYALKLKIV